MRSEGSGHWEVGHSLVLADELPQKPCATCVDMHLRPAGKSDSQHLVHAKALHALQSTAPRALVDLACAYGVQELLSFDVG